MKKRILCSLLIFALLCSALPQTMLVRAEQREKEEYTGNGYEIDFHIDGKWDGAYNATISIKNTGKETIENWYLSFQLADKITNIWNAAIMSGENGKYFIKNAGWNQDIAVGSTVSFGFTAQGETESAPAEYALQATKRLVDDSRYQVTYSCMNNWPEGFTASMTITNVSDSMIEDWRLKFSFGNKISQIWNASILQEDGGQYVIGNEGYNSNIPSKQSVTFGFLCEQGENPGNPEQIALEEYKADGAVVEMGDSETDDSEDDSEIDDSEIDDLEDDSEDDLEIDDSEIEDSDIDEYEEGYEDDLLTSENADQYVHIELQQGNTERCVIDDIVLVNDAEDRYEVQWVSSNPQIISDTGKVSRSEKDQAVVMTAVVKGDGQSVEVPFPLEVKAKSQIVVAEIADYNLDDLEKLNQGNEEFEMIVNDFGYLQEVYGKYSDFKVDSYESALYALYHVKSAIGITDPFTELIPYRTFVDDTGYTFHFAQVIQGMITFENIVVVSSNAQGETDYLKSAYYPVEAMISTIPQISYPEAEEILAKQYGEITVSEEKQNKICVINYYGQVDLVWDICCQLDSKSDEFPSGSYRFLLGAADGEVKFHNALDSDLFFAKKPKKERVRGKGRDLEGKGRSFWVRKEGKRKCRYYLEDIFYHIKVKKGEGNPRRKEKAYSEKEIRKKKNKWKPEEVSAMYHMNKILRFYWREFQRVSYADNNHNEKTYTYSQKRHSQDGAESKVILVHALEDDAYWDGDYNRMYIGSGSGEAISCVSKDGTKNITVEAAKLKKVSFAICQDVLCHEFTHGVMYNDTSLENCGRGIPSAVNEAYADIAACFLEKNWQIGEKIGEKLAIRNISNPTANFTAAKVGGRLLCRPY